VRDHERNSFFEAMKKDGKFSGDIKMLKSDGKEKRNEGRGREEGGVW
jgi:hypothetical protein